MKNIWKRALRKLRHCRIEIAPPDLNGALQNSLSFVDDPFGGE